MLLWSATICALLGTIIGQDTRTEIKQKWEDACFHFISRATAREVRRLDAEMDGDLAYLCCDSGYVDRLRQYQTLGFLHPNKRQLCKKFWNRMKNCTCSLTTTTTHREHTSKQSSNNLDIQSSRLFTPCNQSSNYVQYRGECYKVHGEIKPWNLAEEICKAEGGHLVSILEHHEHSALVVYSKSQNVNDFWIGLKSSNQVDGSESNLFEWTDSKSLHLLKWATNEPSKTGKCGVQKGDGNWTMEPNCSLRKPFVCKLNQRKTSDDQRPIVKGQCPQLQGNGTGNTERFVNVDRSSKYCYFYSDKRTSWPQAQFRCRQNGGHLASFHSEFEIDVVTPLRHARNPETAWIGLYTLVDGQPKWADETPVDYTNYGIPKAWHRRGNCAEMSLIDYKWLESDCNEAKAYFCAVLKSEPK